MKYVALCFVLLTPACVAGAYEVPPLQVRQVDAGPPDGGEVIIVRERTPVTHEDRNATIYDNDSDAGRPDGYGLLYR
jgi:hypothetical protein